MERSDCCMIWWWDLHQRLKYSMDNMQPIISWGHPLSSPYKKFNSYFTFQLQQYKLTRACCVGLERACQHCHGCFLSLQFRNYCFQLLLSQSHGLTDESRVKTVQKNHHKLCGAKDWSFLPHWLLMERNTWLQQIRYWAKRDIWFWFVFLTVASVGSDFKFPMRIGCWIEQF